LEINDTLYFYSHRVYTGQKDEILGGSEQQLMIGYKTKNRKVPDRRFICWLRANV